MSYDHPKHYGIHQTDSQFSPSLIIGVDPLDILNWRGFYHKSRKRTTVSDLHATARSRPLAGASVYTFPVAQAAEQAGLDLVVIGDSLARTWQRYHSQSSPSRK